jgi:hypothetical protein
MIPSRWINAERLPSERQRLRAEIARLRAENERLRSALVDEVLAEARGPSEHASDREHLGSISASVAYGDPSTSDARFDAHDQSRQRIVRDIHDVAVCDARPSGPEASTGPGRVRFLQHETIAAFEPGFAKSNLERRNDMPAQSHRSVDELVPLVRELTGTDAVVPPLAASSSERRRVPGSRP